MKKIHLTLAALFLIFCLSACGTAAQAPDPGRQQTPGTEKTEKPETAAPTGIEAGNEAGNEAGSGNESASDGENREEETEASPMKMQIRIGGKIFTTSLENNAAARELAEMMKKAPVSLDMSDYSGFEKVGALGRSLPADDRRITTVAGDIVLYNGSNIVMFYGTNTWSYTKIGHIDDLTGWEDALGSGSITAVFSLPE